MKTKNSNSPGSLGRKKPEALEVLSEVLNSLAAIYEEAGVPPRAARIAALADFECDFGVLPLAA